MNELIVWIMAFMMATVPPAEQSRRDKVVQTDGGIWELHDWWD